MTLTEALSTLYDNEINVSISCFWDMGWRIAIGDLTNGWHAICYMDNLDDAPMWLIERAKYIYPQFNPNEDKP